MAVGSVATAILGVLALTATTRSLSRELQTWNENWLSLWNANGSYYWLGVGTATDTYVDAVQILVGSVTLGLRTDESAHSLAVSTQVDSPQLDRGSWRAVINSPPDTWIGFREYDDPWIRLYKTRTPSLIFLREVNGHERPIISMPLPATPRTTTTTTTTSTTTTKPTEPPCAITHVEGILHLTLLLLRGKIGELRVSE